MSAPEKIPIELTKRQARIVLALDKSGRGCFQRFIAYPKTNPISYLLTGLEVFQFLLEQYPDVTVIDIDIATKAYRAAVELPGRQTDQRIAEIRTIAGK